MGKDPESSTPNPCPASQSSSSWEKMGRRKEQEENGEGVMGAAGAESREVVPELWGAQSLHFLFLGEKTPSQDLGWSRRKPWLGIL